MNLLILHPSGLTYGSQQLTINHPKDEASVMETLCVQYIPSIYMIETYLAYYQIDKWTNTWSETQNDESQRNHQ